MNGKIIIYVHLPVLYSDGPKIGSPDSRFHVMFGFGEPFQNDSMTINPQTVKCGQEKQK